MTVLDLLNKKKRGTLIADINSKSVDGFTALHFAASEGHTDITMSLIKLGASIDVVSLSLRTPLHVACIRGFTEIILILIQSKSNLNCQDKYGNTPIHILSEGGCVEALEICLNYNPDIKVKNIYGETAVEIATNVETRNVFISYMKKHNMTISKESSPDIKKKLKRETYNRTIIENVILHNNRADMIKSLLFKEQQLDGVDPSKFKAPIQGPLDNSSKTQNKIQKNSKNIKSRRIRILEAAKEISTLKVEDLKLTGVSDKDLEGKIGLQYFDIISMLGKGSFGEVYLVKYKPLDKYYAMKTLNKKRFVGQNLLKYAKAERNVLCYTKSPFIVGLDFAFQTSDKLFLILEYCSGYNIFIL